MPQRSTIVLLALVRPNWALVAVPSASARPSLWAVEDDAEQRERFAYALREAMRAAKLTPPKLAARLDVAPKTVNRWLNGQALPNVMMVRPLADALDVRPELIYDPPDRPDYPLSEYLLRRAGEAGVEEGLRHARRPRRDAGDDEPPVR